MALSPDTIVLDVPEVEAARAFYLSALDPTTADGVLDLHGTGRLALRDTRTSPHAEPSPPGSYVLSAIVEQPTEVEALLAAATAAGAQVVRPAKKGFFGGFTAVYRSPDGAVWKLAAPSKKDTGPARTPPRPRETAIFLGVTRPTASKAFYVALGMAVDRDYGDKFVDFTIADGALRVGVLPRSDLAKDSGVDREGKGLPAAVLTHTAACRNDVDTLLRTAASVGGQATPATQSADGRYVGHFSDPDGYRWQVTAGA